ncbi:phage portal protein [Weissella confusa]|uniref:phage portal protein n=1 Tax=Weissella confusa TaxID=1583 RepID=UPI00280B632E|nr:phage portal protein [Weissella confusa]
MFFEKRSVPIRGSGTSRALSIVNGGLFFTDGYLSAEQAIRNSDVWTAVNIIATDIARVYFHAKDEQVDWLLTHPSRLTNRFNFFQSMVVQMLLDGNAYALRRTDKKYNNGREYFEFLPPSHVTPWLSDDGQTMTYDLRFDNRNEDELKNVDSNDIIHLRWISMNGGLMGQSPLLSLRNELDLQANSRRLSLASLKQAVNPSSILKAKGAKLGEEERAAVRTAFEDAQSGDNAGRLLVLDDLFDYQQLEVKTDIAKLLASTDFTRTQIAKAFLLPVNMLGGESEHSNADQVRADYNQTFARYLAPVVEELEQKLGVNVVPDVRRATDLDGSQIEQRVGFLVDKDILSPEMAQQALLKSQSDLITDDIVAKSELEKTLKEGETTDEQSGSTKP